MAKLTLEDKLEVIKEAKLAESYGPVSVKWRISKPAITYLLSQEEKYLKILENGMNINSKRRPKDIVLNTDIQVKEFVSQMDKRDIPVSRRFISEFAKENYNSNGVENFKGSSGYIQKLKKRINMKRKVLYGEANSVDEVALRKWELDSLDTISEYEPRNIFNCDEAGLVYKFLKNSTYVIENKKNRKQKDKENQNDKENRSEEDKENRNEKEKRGIKQDKSRITVLCTCSSLGEKRKLVFIGYSKKPRNFANFGKNLENCPVDYYHNATAWMNSEIFSNIIKKWDDELKLSGRRILLLLDNFSGHKIDYEPENIKLLFLMPNSTALSQPLDAGIIKNFKDKYDDKVLNYVREYSRADQSAKGPEIIKTMNVYKALLFAHAAWNEVEETTIINCFKHTGVNRDSSCDVSIDHNYSQ